MLRHCVREAAHSQDTLSTVCVFQNIPTLGTVAITMALHNCDEVAVAGFGYNMNTPHAPLHYYEKIRMSAIKQVTSQDASEEVTSRFC